MTQHTEDRTHDSYKPDDQRGTAMPNEPYYQQRQRSGIARIVGTVLLIAGAIWLIGLFSNGEIGLLSGIGGNGTLAEATYDTRRLELDYNADSVEVRGWDEPTTQIEVIYHGGSPSNYALNIEPDGDTLRITGGPNPCFLVCGRRDVEFRITMPTDADAQIQVVNGAISIAEVAGVVNLASTNGRISAEEIAQGLAATTVNGRIELNNVGGAVQAKTTNGEITLEDGTVTSATVETVNGDIDLRGVSGEVNVQTTNGDVAINEANDAALTISTSNGDVEYEGSLVASGTNTITTLNGDVELRLPENSTFDIDANTSSGEIETDFTLQGSEQNRRRLFGAANGGGASLSIGTTSGDINVRGE